MRLFGPQYTYGIDPLGERETFCPISSCILQASGQKLPRNRSCSQHAAALGHPGPKTRYSVPMTPEQARFLLDFTLPT
jgi:hypothetical protein